MNKNQAVRGLGLALVLLVAPPSAGAAGDGYRITPSGYRVPVFGTFATIHGGAHCRRLDPREIAASDIRRLVRARSVAEPARATVQAAPSSMPFVVEYADRAGTGFDDPVLGEQRRAAMASALAAWSRVLSGSVPIAVEARFASSDDPDLLASAAPTDFVAQNGLLVPVALAAQRDASPGPHRGAALTIEFGSKVEWDYVPDGVAQRGAISFVYTAIHEIGHGLGFVDTFDPETGEVSNGLPTPFDIHINRGTSAGNLLVSRSAVAVQDDLVSEDLYFAGPQAVQASLASIRPLPMVRLYAPDPYENGSSISHVDQSTYADVLTGLMVPQEFGPDYAYVDRLALAILADVGYVTNPAAIPAAPGQ